MKSNKGVTIIEGVIACALLSLALGGILSLFTQSIKIGKLVDYTYISINLAKNRIERVREIRREQGVSVLSSLDEQDTLIDIDNDGVPDFKRTTDIDIIDTVYGTKIAIATVSVKYRIKGNWSPNSVELATKVSPYL